MVHSRIATNLLRYPRKDLYRLDSGQLFNHVDPILLFLYSLAQAQVPNSITHVSLQPESFWHYNSGFNSVTLNPLQHNFVLTRHSRFKCVTAAWQKYRNKKSYSFFNNWKTYYEAKAFGAPNKKYIKVPQFEPSYNHNIFFKITDSCVKLSLSCLVLSGAVGPHGWHKDNTVEVY